MICKKHGEVGEPLSNGNCIDCEREEIGEEGLEVLRVLLQFRAIGDKTVLVKDVMNEVKYNLKNKIKKAN